MKKIITILLITMTLTNCSKDNETSSNRSDLIIGIWNMESINGGPISVDPLQIQYEFKENGVFLAHFNPGNEPQEGTWSLNSNGTKLTIINDPYDILNLTDNSMKLFLPYIDSKYSIEYIFSRVE
jgi:hypothetical protein